MGLDEGDHRGILNPSAGERHFDLARSAPSADLGDLVDRFWSVQWDLRGRPPFVQETLPYPCVDMVMGTHRPGIHGPTRARFTAVLEGRGWVFGVKFRPGGFRGLLGRPLSTLTDRVVGVGALFGPEGTSMERALHAATTDDERRALVETFLLARFPPPDPEGELASRAVEIARAEAGLCRVAALSARVGLSVRSLQRLFASYVGARPKWVIARFRIHDAAARLATGECLDFPALADELGYADQAHFIRDFKAQTGKTPAAYAADQVAEAATRASTARS